MRKCATTQLRSIFDMKKKNLIIFAAVILSEIIVLVALVILFEHLEGVAKVVMTATGIGFILIYDLAVIYVYLRKEIKRTREIQTKNPEQIRNREKYPFI
jgi:hypothetical protein